MTYMAHKHTSDKQHVAGGVDQSGLDCAAALFAYELEGGGVSDDVVRAIHAGVFGEWVGALEHSGLFTGAEIAALLQLWTRTPRELLDMLLGDADEITRRRSLATWAGLERAPQVRSVPLAQ